MRHTRASIRHSDTTIAIDIEECTGNIGKRMRSRSNGLIDALKRPPVDLFGTSELIATCSRAKTRQVTRHRRTWAATSNRYANITGEWNHLSRLMRRDMLRWRFLSMASRCSGWNVRRQTNSSTNIRLIGRRAMRSARQVMDRGKRINRSRTA